MIEKISKQSETYHELKDMLKNNKCLDKVATDDLSILKLCLSYPVQLDKFFYCDELLYQKETQEIIDKLKNISKNIYTLSKTLYEQLRQKENSAGLFGILKMNPLQLKDFKNKSFIVVCDRLEIPGNLGTIYRTLDSAKVDGIILVDAVTKPTNSKLVSSSRGCNLLIPTVCDTYEHVQKWLLDNEYTIYLGEPNLGQDYQSYDYKGKTAIVVGSERFGIHNEWYDNLHKKVFIPMFGSNNSLNVGVACSIIVYEARMKRNK